MNICKSSEMNAVLRLFVGALIFQITTGSREKKPLDCQILNKYDAVQNPVGDIYSPFYEEKGEYPVNIWCEYKITASPGNILKLTFVDLDIEPSSSCHGDQLIIYANKIEDVIDTVCGNEKLEPIITEPGENIVHFLFMADFLVSGRGFHIRYEAASHFERCPGLSTCQNLKCYNETQHKCNGVDDCGDGTDEENCNLPLPTTECGNTPIVPNTVFGEQNRIVGGQEAIPGSWPWQVSLQDRYSYYSHSCGGSLINAQWFITSGHCFQKNPFVENYRIHVGKHHKFSKDTNEQIRYAERIIIWPNITGETLEGHYTLKNDIALVKLNAPIKFDNFVQPICIPDKKTNFPPGTISYTTGWGETRGTGASNVLKQLELSLLSRDDCKFSKLHQVCGKGRTGFQSTCHGDSGGPLVTKVRNKWFLIGATSYGNLNNIMHGLCAAPGQITVFAKVPYKANWIRKMVKKYS